MTRLFYAERLGDGGAEARALLSRAWRAMYGGDMPLIAKTPDGKPFFPARPDVFFSISHTKTHVLAALGDAPVGADAETVRDVREGVKERVCAASELAQFDFFELWTLKESFIKLFGDAPPLRELTFRRGRCALIPPRGDVSAALYGDIPGCAAAVCVLGGEPPGEAERL